MADTKLAKIGITVKEPWAAGISYEPLDYVLWRTQDGGDGCGYIAKRANIGVQPDSDDSVWIKSAQAGQSIYDLAVKYHHFDGTEEEFEQQYQQVLQDARDAASDTLATNTEVQNAEALRVAAEQARVSAESARAEAETDRQDAEDARASEESDREAAESARESAEASRQSAETRRASAESARSTAEVEREMAEEARGEAETEREADFEALKTDMQTAIGQVDAATAAAVATNTSIQSAEADRVTAETARETAESGRVSAESARVTAENGRVSAESGRVSAESARVSAETARVAQASSDHTRAESDHGTAATDHTTAGADHTQAGADHTASEAATTAANTAAAAADAARESIQDDLARKANIDGSYETMSVGLAKNLEGRTDVTGSFLERTTGGDAEVANGLAQLQEVDGKSQVWNQLLYTFSPLTITQGSLTYTYGSDGSIVLNGTCDVEPNNDLYRWGNFYSTLNHIYYITSGGADVIIEQTNNGAFVPNISKTGAIRKAIIECTTAGRPYLRVSAILGTTYSNYKVYPQLIDLTLLFGSGNEPETVEEFEAWLASNIGLRDYYPYNAGTVLNVNMTGIETLGFNLLDPATGKARIIGAYSDVYGNYYGITGTHGTITFTSDLGETSTITPDSDGKFLLEEPGELTVADAGADCSVFLWWDGTKTEHEDYERTVTNLDVAHIYGKLNGTGDLVKVWPTGMPGIGDVKDALKVVDGAVVAERKMGEVDMGTLEWDYAVNHDYSRFAALLNNVYADNWVPVIVNSYGYVASGVPIINNSLNLGLAYYGGKVYLRNDAYSDAATFKTAMNGVMLYYELATPQTYTDLVYQGSALFPDGTPVTMPTNYPVNNWSVERIVPQNSSEAVVTTAPELTCRYSIDAVETLNTHADEIENLYDGLDELDAKKSNKVGDYPGLSVGTARNLSAENAVPAEYVFRKTPDGAATGIATVQRIKGKSVVWNQLVQSLSSTRETGGLQITNNFPAMTISGTATAAGAKDVAYNIPIVVGHKYYVSLGGFPDTIALAGASGAAKSIITAINNTGTLGAIVVSGNTYNVTFTPIVIDLTLMFGAGNEPATVAEFEAMYPLPYYDYNAGEIVNNEAEAIETVGFNQWDEEVVAHGSNQIESKNYIPVIPNATYYAICRTPGNQFDLYARFYNAGKELIETKYVNSITFTIPSGCSYIKLETTRISYGTTYTHDICLNLSDAAKNGQYEPYEKHTLQLGLNSFDVNDSEGNIITVNGLKSAGSVYDEIDLARGKYIKRVGEVDLGTLTWASNTLRFYANIPGSAGYNGKLDIPQNIICELYKVAASIYDFNDSDKVVTIYDDGKVTVKDSAYSSSADFKTAMSGVMLYYELAEPVEYDLVNPIQTNYDVISGGTERRLPEDTASSVLAPIAYDVKYTMNATGILANLPQGYISKVSMDHILTALKTAGVISNYTLTYNASNGCYDCTITA